MSQFYINPGELRTKIRIQKQVSTGTGSFATKTWVDIGNASDTDLPRYTMSKWESLKGIEKWLSDSLQDVQAATATVRYNSQISSLCRIVNGDLIFQIIDVSDPTQRKQWLQLTMKASVNG